MMKTETTATVVNKGLKLDAPISLPEQSRVRVTIESIAQESPDDAHRRAAWERFKRRVREHPIDSGGEHFTRDELHERH